jgi:hypothetical protein
MDAIVKKVKELLEASDPDITVSEADDLHAKEPNGETIEEPPVDPAIS